MIGTSESARNSDYDLCYPLSEENTRLIFGVNAMMTFVDSNSFCLLLSDQYAGCCPLYNLKNTCRDYHSRHDVSFDQCCHTLSFDHYRHSTSFGETHSVLLSYCLRKKVVFSWLSVDARHVRCYHLQHSLRPLLLHSSPRFPRKYVFVLKCPKCQSLAELYLIPHSLKAHPLECCYFQEYYQQRDLLRYSQDCSAMHRNRRLCFYPE